VKDKSIISDDSPRIAYSAREAAELLRVRYQTVLAEIRAGRLVARRVGKEYRIHRDMIEIYLKTPEPENVAASTANLEVEDEMLPSPAKNGRTMRYEKALLDRLRGKSGAMDKK
jgi:excisionase family DNA binding protein